MNKKIIVRTVLGLLGIAVLFAAYKWFEGWTMDPDLGSTDTTDMVTAVEHLENGSRIVLFDPKGKKTEVPGYVEGRYDVDPVWRPDGQRVFFSSNREGSSNNIFRWNVASNSVERRLESSRSAGSPYFGPPDWPGLEDSGLITLGGAIFDYNQTEKRTRQLLPPLQFQNVDEEQQGHLEVAYERIGGSFKSAKWGQDRKVMFAVMRREDAEVFVVNYMEPIGEFGIGPAPLFAGQSIQFDVAQDGTAVVSIQGFEFADPTQIPPDMIVDGRATKPWRNALIAVSMKADGRFDAIPLYSDGPDPGINPEELTAESRAEHGVPGNVQGLLVHDIQPGSAAERIGMKTGDVLVSIGGKTFTTFDQMVEALRTVRFGIPTTMTFWSAAEKATKAVQHTFGGETAIAVRDPAVSPDSSSVAAVVGLVRDRYTFEPLELVVIPVQPMGLNSSKRLVSGRISEPHWHPSGDKLTFAMLGEGGDSQIYVIGADGSGMRNLSGPGQYGSPKFSPFQKGS